MIGDCWLQVISCILLAFLPLILHCLAMSSSDSGESTPPQAFGGIHFTLGGPVQVGAPGYRPSPELMSLAASFMPFLNARIRENEGARDQQADVNTEDDGGNDGQGPKKKSGGSGTEDQEMKVEDGVGASSSTGMAQGDSNQAAPKQAGSKKKQRRVRRARRARRSTDRLIALGRRS